MGLFSDLLRDFPALSVAKERIALAEEKYQASEKENAVLKARVAQLVGENASLKQKLATLEVGEPGDPTEDEVRILETVKDLGKGRGKVVIIAEVLKAPPERVKYYAKSLYDRKYLTASFNAMYGTTYSLAQKGRELLIRTGKL